MEAEEEPLTPTPQQDTHNPVCAILYSHQFTHTMDLFRTVLRRDERSARALQITTDTISLNPANYTAWHFRRLCLEHLQQDLAPELHFLSECANENPKNYQLWQHRRWIVTKLQHPQQELEHTRDILNLDQKNYHAWAHRQWAVKTFNLWDEQLEFAHTLISEDPSRSLLLLLAFTHIPCFRKQLGMELQILCHRTPRT
jgi:protein farnesyltransferase/geranylgeranyltransferase type-1 subunit alpha